MDPHATYSIVDENKRETKCAHCDFWELLVAAGTKRFASTWPNEKLAVTKYVATRCIGGHKY